MADPSQAGERIDKYLALELDGYSRSFLQKQLKDGNVTVGDKPVKSSYQLAEDDEICVFIPDNREPDILPEDIPCLAHSGSQAPPCLPTDGCECPGSARLAGPQTPFGS